MKGIRQHRRDKCRKELTHAFGLRARKPIRVLEIGSGKGQEVLRLAKSGALCTAVEISVKECSIIKEKIRQEKVCATINVVHADGQNLPFREDVFDVIFCNAVLHHTLKPLQVIQEMRRAVKDNGIVAAIDESNALNPFWHFAKFIVQSTRLGDCFYPFLSGYYWEFKDIGYATSFYPWELEYFFRKAGLRHIKVMHLWLPYYLIQGKFFKAYLLLEIIIEKTPIPYIFGQLFILGKK